MESSLATDRVAGAYLLHGPSGVGRALGAQVFAAALLCSSPKGAAACGACRSCRSFAAGTHPDALALSAETGPHFKDDADADRARLDAFSFAARRAAKREARRTIPVRSLRRMLDFVSLAPAAGGRRAVLIDSFDEVEEAGAATLLKSLEEAPRLTTFLVLAGSVESVPDTILSRCQRVRFRPLADDVVRRLLTTRGGDAAASLDDGARDLLVRLAQGSAGRAIRAAERGAQGEAAACARSLVGEPRADACERAVAWVYAEGRDLAPARERVREVVALALLFARDRAAADGTPAILDATLPALRLALEGVDANVAPDLVVRALWARCARLRSLSN
jgi:DNA polymerase-3 subunit delta'